jgi:CBS domain-containing protein
MQAKEVMVRVVAAVRAEDTLARAAAILRDRGCGAVVVVQPGPRPVAIVTDRDICMAALRTNKPLSDLPVASAMSRALHVAAPDEDVAALADRMALHQVRRLPVVDDRGLLVGLVALDDLARVAREQADLFAPAVAHGLVGAALGDIVRLRFVGSPAEGAGGPPAGPRTNGAAN